MSVLEVIVWVARMSPLKRRPLVSTSVVNAASGIERRRPSVEHVGRGWGLTGRCRARIGVAGSSQGGYL